MIRPTPSGDNVTRAAVLRTAGFLALWAILTLGNPADLPAGIVTAFAATWVSLRLLQPRSSRLSPVALVAFLARFFSQSAVAGLDVAWRALDPRMPLHTGFIVFRTRLREGRERSTFCALASLLPGTLPADAQPEGNLLVHCLDVEQAVAVELTVDESLFCRTLVEGRER